MSNDSPSDKIRELLNEAQTAGTKMQAAELMLEAGHKELDAMIVIGDGLSIERARQTCLARYEAFLDVRIAETRRLRDLGSRLTS